MHFPLDVFKSLDEPQEGYANSKSFL